jgi:hypothetical protein
MKRFLVASSILTLAIMAVAAYAPFAEAKSKSSRRVGACPTASSRDSRGHRCGKRSAYDRGPTRGYDSEPKTVYQGEYQGVQPPQILPQQVPTVIPPTTKPLTTPGREGNPKVATGWGDFYIDLNTLKTGETCSVMVAHDNSQASLSWTQATAQMPDKYKRVTVQGISPQAILGFESIYDFCESSQVGK